MRSITSFAIIPLALLGFSCDAKPKTKVMEKEIINSIGMKMILIPAGEFMMGSPDTEMDRSTDETPQHRVWITKPFYLGQNEVTVAQFRNFVEDSGYKTDGEKDGKGSYGFDLEKGCFSKKPEYTWQNTGFQQTDDHPVVNVSWNDAVAFCEWLSRKEGKRYQLPTEAQWEHACRAGTTTRYWSGDDAEALAKVGNVADAAAKAEFSTLSTISASDGYLYAAPVGRFRPNAFGLHDLHGNVWEWCQDWYSANYYSESPEEDPPGPTDGSIRALRGGSWYDGAGLCRSANRFKGSPDDRSGNLGFRVAQVIE